MDTSDDWIRQRTGIARRHLLEDGESTSDMAIAAAREALRVADADPRDIGLVIVATATPDTLMPSTACRVQNALGATHAGAYDLNAGCSGFVYALASAQQAIASKQHELVLVIGADALSRVVDWEDRSTAVLFGDGAGAVLMQATEGDSGVLATLVGSDGSGSDVLIIPAGGSALPASQETVADRQHYLHMNGREVFRFAVRILPRATRQVAEMALLDVKDLDLIVPHQANYRIIESAARRLKIEPERFYLNLKEYGNTSAASIPIALCDAIKEGRVQPGDHVAMVGFGAGLTWAAAVLRWSSEPLEKPAPRVHIWLRWMLYRWAAGRTWLERTWRRIIIRFIRGAER